MAAEFENGENSMGGDAGSGDGGKVRAVLEVEGEMRRIQKVIYLC